MNYLLDLDDKIVIAKSDSLQALEDWAQDEMTNNYDVIDTTSGFSKAYPVGELATFYANLTEEVDGIDFDFTDTPRPAVANKVLSVIVKDNTIPTIDEGGLPMVKKRAVKKTAAAKKSKAPVKKAATSSKTRTSTASTQKVKRGTKPKSETSVMGSIYAFCTKQMTIDDICEGMVATGYTPPRRSEPADAGYLKGYISAMIREGSLEKV